MPTPFSRSSHPFDRRSDLSSLVSGNSPVAYGACRFRDWGRPPIGSLLGIIQTDVATSKLKFEPITAAIRALAPEKPIVFAGLRCSGMPKLLASARADSAKWHYC